MRAGLGAEGKICEDYEDLSFKLAAEEQKAVTSTCEVSFALSPLLAPRIRDNSG